MIGDKLKELRKKKGNTQADLARVVGVSTKSVKNWESDISDPDLSHAKAIADYYNVSLDELVGRDLGDCILLGKMCEPDKRRVRAMIRAYTKAGEGKTD